MQNVYKKKNYLFFYLFILQNNYRSQTCDCNNSNITSTLATTVNPTRNTGNAGNPGAINPIPSVLATGGCSCSSITNNNAGNGLSNSGNGNTANINSGTGYEDSTTSNAETLLSSNAKFQSISAIAVAQDGVINVADQGMHFRFCFFKNKKKI